MDGSPAMYIVGEKKARRHHRRFAVKHLNHDKPPIHQSPGKPPFPSQLRFAASKRNGSNFLLLWACGSLDELSPVAESRLSTIAARCRQAESPCDTQTGSQHLASMTKPARYRLIR